jgi:hypothetical protein
MAFFVKFIGSPSLFLTLIHNYAGYLMNVVFTCLFICLSLVMCAQQESRLAVTAEETPAVIARLTDKRYAEIKRLYSREGALLSETYFQEHPLCYMIEYYSSEVKRQEGLVYYGFNHEKTGLWKYYKPDGKLYKQADYYTFNKTLIGSLQEPAEEVVQLVLRNAEELIKSRTGVEFFNAHVRFSRSSRWYCSNDDSFYGWLDTPAHEDSMYFDIIYDIMFEDSIRFPVYKFVMDSKGAIIGNIKEAAAIPGCIDRPARCSFNVSFSRAVEIASKEKFPVNRSALEITESGYEWVFERIDKETSSSKETTELHIATDTARIEYISTKSTWGHGDHYYPYKRLYNDTIPAAGYKRITVREVQLQVPLSWTRYEEYYENKNSRFYLTNGYDTLYYEADDDRRVYNDRVIIQEHLPELKMPYFKANVLCRLSNDPSEQEKLWRECDSINKAIDEYNISVQMEYKRWQDSLAFALLQERRKEQELEEKKKAIIGSFIGSFEDGSLMGRPLELSLNVDETNKWSLTLVATDDPEVFPVRYRLSASGLTEEKMLMMLDMLKKTRFRYF